MLRDEESVKIVPFEMERWQSTWENSVDFNLSESGVQPIPLRELLGDEAATEPFLDYPLAYSQGNGTPELRAKIAAMYHDASPNHVLVTNGSSEANFLSMWHLVERGDEVVVMLPNYMENWGVVQMFGGHVKPLRLQEGRKWQFDPDELGSLVTPKTKAIAICNPDNPTGAVMGEAQRKAVLDAAQDRGAWLLSDEVYIGAEREGPRTESVWGEYERTLIVNGLSKAYALRINSSELAWRLLKEKSTLIVPGDHFGMDGFIRIGMGDAQAYLTQGLERIDALIREIRTEKGKS